jgi:hypothetical protein
VTPRTLAFLLWEGPAAAGLALEYLVWKPYPTEEEALSELSAYVGPAATASLVIGTWCLLGPLLFIRSTLPKALLRFIHWADGITTKLQDRAARMRAENIRKRTEVIKRVALEEFNRQTIMKYPTAVCSTCKMRWPVFEDQRLGRFLSKHPSVDILEPCPGKVAEGKTYPPEYP